MSNLTLKQMATDFILAQTDYEYMDGWCARTLSGRLFDFFDTDDREKIDALADLISSAKIEVSW